MLLNEQALTWKHMHDKEKNNPGSMYSLPEGWLSQAPEAYQQRGEIIKELKEILWLWYTKATISAENKQARFRKILALSKWDALTIRQLKNQLYTEEEKENTNEHLTLCGIPVENLTEDQRTLFEEYKNDTEAMAMLNKIVYNKDEGVFEFEKLLLPPEDSEQGKIFTNITSDNIPELIWGWRYPTRQDFWDMMNVMPGVDFEKQALNLHSLTWLFGNYHTVDRDKDRFLWLTISSWENYVVSIRKNGVYTPTTFDGFHADMRVAGKLRPVKDRNLHESSDIIRSISNVA